MQYNRAAGEIRDFVSKALAAKLSTLRAVAVSSTLPRQVAKLTNRSKQNRCSFTRTIGNLAVTRATVTAMTDVSHLTCVSYSWHQSDNTLFA
jgi:hypothetical protein